MRFDWREIVSRLAMLLMAALCAAAGLGLIHAGNVIFPYEANPSGGHYSHGDTSTSHYLYVGGSALMGVGMILLGGVFMPPRKQ